MNPRERREDILGLDVAPDHLTDSVRQQLAGMLERPMRLFERLVVFLVAVSTLAGSIVVCGLLALKADLAGVQRFCLFAALLLAALGAVWSLSLLKRGVFRPTTDDVLLEAVVWAFFVIVVCWEIFVERGDGAMTDVIATIALVGFPFTWSRVKAAELRTRETILRIALYSQDRPEENAPEAAEREAHAAATSRARPAPF